MDAENLQHLLRCGKNLGAMNTSPSDTRGAFNCPRRFSAHFWSPVSSKSPGQCPAMEYSLPTTAQ